MRTSVYIVSRDSQDKTYYDVCCQDSRRRRPSWSCLATPKKPTFHHRTADRRKLDIPSGSAAPDDFAVSDLATLPTHAARASLFETCFGNIVAPFLEDDDASLADDESTLAERYDMTSLTSKASLNSPTNQFIAGSLHSRVDMRYSVSSRPSHPYPFPHYFSTSYRAPERVLDYSYCMRLAGMREVRRYLLRISRNKFLVMHLVAHPILLVLKTF
jgi:hypothetical protein